MSVSSHHFGTLTLAIIIWRLITPRLRRSRIRSSQLQIRISTASVQSAVNQWTSKPADWCYDSMPDQTNSFPVNFVRVNIPQFRFSFRLQLISLIYVRQIDQHSNYRIFVQASRYTVPTLVSCPQAFLHLPYIRATWQSYFWIATWFHSWFQRHDWQINTQIFCSGLTFDVRLLIFISRFVYFIYLFIYYASTQHHAIQHNEIYDNRAKTQDANKSTILCMRTTTM